MGISFFDKTPKIYVKYKKLFAQFKEWLEYQVKRRRRRDEGKRKDG
jgi:hypothetical protein